MKRLWAVTVEFEGFVWAESQVDAEDLANKMMDEWCESEVHARKIDRKHVPADCLTEWPTAKGDNCPGPISKCLDLQEEAEAELARLERIRTEWESHPKLEFEDVAA